MTTEYRPIACGAYDQIEILAMHRSKVEITTKDDKGSITKLLGRVLDTSIHDGAEYLVLESAKGLVEIRLDYIQQIYDQQTASECWEI